MRAHLNSGVREVAMQQVAMSDLDAGVQMVYRHDGSETNRDDFSLSLSGGRLVARATAVVKITPVNDARPEIVTNSGLRVRYGNSDVIRSSLLKATDDDNVASEIHYVIISAPRKGVLELEASSEGATTEESMHKPLGQLLKIGDSFTQADVDTGRLTYSHTKSFYGDDNELAAYDSFIFQLTDGTNPVSHETFEVEITQQSATATLVQDDKKSRGTAVLWNRGFSLVGEEVSSVITVEALNIDASDDLKPANILYILVKQPVAGFIAVSNETDVFSSASWRSVHHSSRLLLPPVSSFSQLDVNDRRVLYVHTFNSTHLVGGVSAAGAQSDGFDFIVVDKRDNTTVSSTARFEISLRRRTRHTSRPSTSYLSLAVNVPLTVVHGDRALLTASNLRIASLGGGGVGGGGGGGNLQGTFPPLTDLLYKLVELPKHGKLLKSDVAVTSFTQHDLNSGAVSYRSDSSDESMMDYFLFQFCSINSSSSCIDNAADSSGNITSRPTAAINGKANSTVSVSRGGHVTNGTTFVEQKPMFFSILIQPTSKIPPTLVRCVPPVQLTSVGSDRYGFVFSGENLKATHPLFEARDLVYNVKTKPRHGSLEHLGGGRRRVKRKFTQKDIDEGRIAFVLNDQTRATNDSFSFRVMDRNRNAIDDQK